MGGSSAADNSDPSIADQVSRAAEQAKELQESAASLIARTASEEDSLRQRAKSLDSTIQTLFMSNPGKEKSQIVGNVLEVFLPLAFSKLLSYADALDWILMALGTLGSIVHGLAQPIGYLLLGKALNAFGEHMGHIDEMVDALYKVHLHRGVMQGHMGWIAASPAGTLPLVKELVIP